MKNKTWFRFGLVLILIFAAHITHGFSETDPPSGAVTSDSVKEAGREAAPQAQGAMADKEMPDVIALGDVAEIKNTKSFKRLVEKSASDKSYEKLRIEYLLERLSRTTYNFVRNGETHNGKVAAAHMRYKWSKFRSEVKTAEDFVAKIAAGSRASGAPYYMKANRRYYLTRDILFFELSLLDQALLQFQEGKGK